MSSPTYCLLPRHSREPWVCSRINTLYDKANSRILRKITYIWIFFARHPVHQLVIILNFPKWCSPYHCLAGKVSYSLANTDSPDLEGKYTRGNCLFSWGNGS